MKVLMRLQNNIETEIKPAIEKIEKKLSANVEEVKENLKNNIIEVKEDLKNNAKAVDDKLENFDKRMNQIEDRMRCSNFQRMKATGLIPQISSPASQLEDMRPKDIPPRPTKKTFEDNFSTCSSLNWNDHIEAEELAKSLEAVDITNKNDMNDKIEKTSNKDIKKRKLDDMKKNENDFFIQKHQTFDKIKPIVNTNKETQKTRNQKDLVTKKFNRDCLIPNKILKWFGDEPESSSEESSEIESDKEDNDNWQGKIDRKNKNREKRKINLLNRKMKREMTSRKAKHIIGISPITPNSINFYKNDTNTFAEAKILAAQEFLQHYLDYTDGEISEIKITETQISNKGDNTLYISLENHDDIREIHVRCAEVKNIRNFIPPQFHSRYMGINRICSEMRSNDKDLKTQLRFGNDDIDILMKSRKSGEGFKKVKITDLPDYKSIPEYDYDIAWKPKQDKQPRRKVRENLVKPLPPSRRNKELPLSRQNSLGTSPHMTTKKPRQENIENTDHDMSSSDTDSHKSDSESHTPSSRKISNKV